MSELAPHQQRVVDEKKALDEKLDKLTTFMSSDKFETVVGSQERYWLVRQAGAMTQYSQILAERIAAF